MLRPDHFLSTVAVEPQSLLDDGQTTGRLRIVLRDWRGVQLPFGGAQLTVVQESGPAIAIGAAVDGGDGTYTVPIGPASAVGQARLSVRVFDGVDTVRLSPSVAVDVTGDSLWLSRGSIDAFADNFDAVLRGGSTFANRTGVLLASLSGTSPGIVLGPGLVLPLVPDALTSIMIDLANNGPPLLGALDGQGRRVIPFVLPAGLLLPLRGSQLDFAWLTLSPIDFASNAASLQLR